MADKQSNALRATGGSKDVIGGIARESASSAANCLKLNLTNVESSQHFDDSAASDLVCC